MKVMRKTNAKKTEVYENEVRRIQWRWRCLHVTLKAITLFVVQPTGSAPVSTGSAKTGNVSTRIMCVTAKTAVATVLTKEIAVSCFLWQWYMWTGNQKATGLPTYKPLWLAVAHPLRWSHRTCSETKSFNNGHESFDAVSRPTKLPAR